MVMRVPVNPGTRVPTGQLGYGNVVDISSGIRQLGNVVRAYGEEYQREEKRRELFDVQRLLVDETNAIQTDFEERKTNAPAGAAGFTQQINDDYLVRHNDLAAKLKENGFSEDAIQEFSTRLGTIRAQYVARAIDFQDKSQFAKTVADSDDMALGLSQYTNSNPGALPSALDEFRMALENSGLDAIEKQEVFERGRGVILRGAQEGFAMQYPETVLQLYGMPSETEVKENPETGELVNLGNAQQTVATELTNAGMNPNVVAGFLGNFHVEGGYTGKKGDNGSASGIAQWRKERRAAFKAMFGKDPHQATIAEQAKFVVHEMNNPQQAGMTVAQRNAILNAKSPEEAAELVDKYYERSAGKHTKQRKEAAKTFISTMVHAEQTEQHLVTPGNIDTSKLPAVKSADGSVSTVRSISIEQDGKTYLIPTVVDGKIVSDDQAVAHFNETGQHLGVFETKEDADAYAQDLHNREARRVGLGDERGKTGIAVLDMSTGSERMAMLTTARSIINHRNAEANAAAKAQHDEQFNTLLNGLNDGRMGIADINKARQDGWLTDYDEIKKAQGILEAKTEKDDGLARFGTMITRDIRGNPYSKEDQKAVDEGFDFTTKREPDKNPFFVGLQIWQKTGVLPTQAGVMIRGALIGTDPQSVASAASVASNMLEANPNAFAGVDGGEDIGQAAATYAHYVDDLGMSADDAANKIAAMNSPEFKAKVKVDEPNRTKFIKTLNERNIESTLNNAILGERGFFRSITDMATLGATNNRGSFTSTPQSAEAKQTFTELALDHYDKYYDQGAAVNYASRQMARLYGVENGRILKYPSSKAYPEIQGSREYVYDQAKEDVDAYAGFSVPKEDIWLQPTPNGSTAAAFRAGRPAPYEIWFRTIKNDQPVYFQIPGKVFVADVDRARREAAKNARKIEQRIRQQRSTTEEEIYVRSRGGM